MVVAGEIDGGLEGHGLQPLLKRVHAAQLLRKAAPSHDASVQRGGVVGGKQKCQ